jgi:predicted HNH restriction endonuclease
MGKRYPNMSDEEYINWKKKLSDAHIGKKSWNTGKHWTSEQKQNLSKAHKGYIMPETQKEKIRNSCSVTWNLPQYKEMNRRIQRKRIEDGTHNLLEIIKLRQENARIRDYDLKKSEWKQLSKKIMLRDSYVCQSCGQSFPAGGLNVHHLLPYSMSKDNSEQNLITLCVSCHASIEYFTKLALSRTGGERVENC